MSGWLPRTKRARCFCHDLFWRPIDADYNTCLKCQIARALLTAGFTWKSPELVFVAEWNAAAQRRAGIIPAAPAASTGTAA